MATKNISIRLSLQDQEVVKRGLKDVGNEGAAALKKIEDGGAPAAGKVKLLGHQIGNLNQQLIDVAVQLQGGQNPFTILTQQGPQMVFAVGGMRNAISLLGRAFTPMGLAVSGGALAIGGLAAGLGIAASKMLDVQSEAREFGTSIRAMGRDADLSAGQLRGMVDAMQRLGVSRADARLALNAAVRVPGATGAGIGAVSGMAGDAAAAFGGDIADWSKRIAEISTLGVPAIEKLQESYRLLTAEQMESVHALGLQGEVAKAADIAFEALAKRVGGELEDSLSETDKSLRKLSAGWNDFATALADSGFGAVALGVLDAIAMTVGAIGTAMKKVPVKEFNAALASIDGKFFDPNKAAGDANYAGFKAKSDAFDAYMDSIGRGVKTPETPQEAFIAKANKEYENQLKILSAIADEREIIRAGIEAEAKGSAAALNPAQMKAYIALEKERAKIKIDAARRDKAAADAERKSESAAAKAADDAKKAEAERIKVLEDEAKWLFKVRLLVEKDVEAWEKKNALLPDYIRNLEQDYRLAGLTAEKREEELAVIEAAKLAVNGLTAADEEHIRAIVRATDAQEEAQKQIEESARFIPEAFDQAFDRVGSAITDAFARGEDGLINMRDLGRAVAADLAQSFVQLALLNPVKNFLFGGTAVTLGDVLGGGGGSGALGTAANGASLANFFSGGSLTAGIGAKLFGTAGTMSLAGGGTNATAGLLGSGGLTGAAGGAIPIAGATIAALGILRGLGVIGPGKSVGPNAGAQLIESGGVFAVGPSGADNGGSTAGVIAEVSQAVQVLNALAMGIGVAQIGDGLASYIDTFKAGGIGNASDLVKDAISKGVVEGLTEAEQALISASGDVGATAEEIITARTAKATAAATASAFPGLIAGQRLELEDPQQFAINALNAERDGLVAFAETLTDNAAVLADIAAIYDFRLGEINARFTETVAVVDTAAESLKNWAEANDGFTRILEAAAAQEREAAQLKAADAARITGEAAGLQDQINRLTLTSTELRALEREAIADVNKPLFDRITLLQSEPAAIAAANDNMSAFNSQIESISRGAQDAAQALQNTADSLKAFLDVLDSGPLSSFTSRDQLNIARAKFAASPNEENARSLLELSRDFAPGIGFARDSANVRQSFGNAIAATPGRIQGVYASAASAASALAAARDAQTEGNRLAPLAAGASADFWNVRRTGSAEAQATFAASVSDEIKAILPEFGGMPRFAGGGATPVNRPFIVGERGPEIMRMNVPGMVTSNADSFGATSEIKGMRGQIDRLERVMINVAAKTVDMENRQRKWDATGLLTRTA